MAFLPSLNRKVSAALPGQVPSRYAYPIPTTSSRDTAYKDTWDIRRAIDDGMNRSTWVFRAIDIIASNAARLPIVVRRDDPTSGPIVQDHPIAKLLNVQPNPYESPFQWKWRLVATYLVSRKGAFVETIMANDNTPSTFYLLPPQVTNPVPDPRRFVAGYELERADGSKEIINPDKVVWVRHPHPIDPYKGMTPLEAAGLAIDTDFFARLYNREFLANDGRPGGFLLLNSDLDPADEEEILARMQSPRGRGPMGAGRLTVLAGEGDMKYVDVSVTPRDAQYQEGMANTKAEVLQAFGVPESLLGNASGRTYDNASVELEAFWRETMQKHLTIVANAFNPIDGDPNTFISFDLSTVAVLQRDENNRRAYLLQEFQGNAITRNEYRVATGRPPIEDIVDIDPTAELTSTGKPSGLGDDPPQSATQVSPAVNGVDVPGGDQPTPQEQQPPRANQPGPPPTGARRRPSQPGGSAKHRREAWERLYRLQFDRYFKRQEQVIVAKLHGPKAQKALTSGKFDIASVFDLDVWNKQLAEDMRVLQDGLVRDYASAVAAQLGKTEADVADVCDASCWDKTLDMLPRVNAELCKTLGEAIAAGINVDDVYAGFGAATAEYVKALLTVGEQAALAAAVALAPDATKTWVADPDCRIAAHAELDGITVALAELFDMGELDLASPGDIVGCVCHLEFDFAGGEA